MLIIDTINIDSAEIMNSVIFIVGFFITITFVLFKMFSKVEEIEPKNQDYYSRHGLPVKEKNKKEGIF
tara:strand:+ start:136 stop:339 length:204 start_codon:yes stop_codon:yes gene_type:complete